MRQPAFDQITEAQRVCLRLVYSHHNSKEIAALVGVSPSAIDKRLERAVQVLQVATRFEAARLLHDHERHLPSVAVTPTYELLPSEPIDLPPSPSAAPTILSYRPWWPVRRFLGLTPGGGMDGSARIRSTRIERFVRLVVLTVLIAVASVAMVNLMLTVTAMLRANRGAAAPTAWRARPTGTRQGGKTNAETTAIGG